MKFSPTAARSIPKLNLAVQTNKETTDMEADSIEPNNIVSHNHMFEMETTFPIVQDREN